MIRYGSATPTLSSLTHISGESSSSGCGLEEAAAAAAGFSAGSWQLLVANSGVSAMHMAVSHTNKVIILDRTDYGPSAIKLPAGRCRNDSADIALKIDCWAHSVEYDITSISIRPLEVLTDTWCSSGAFSADGTLIQTGGWNDGAKVVRRYGFCASCDWIEQPGGLSRRRWYASNQILPDGRVIILGGRREFSYEFVPGDGYYNLPFLQMTSDARAENNLYPFLHLSSDGNLFIFANADSILFNYRTSEVVRQYPTLPGGARNYPASGSSVLLPLLGSESFKRVEVMICGGALKTAFQEASSGNFITALKTCGRMVITDVNPSWVLEDMPLPRVMGDMLNLPTGDVLIINGAQRGTAGWGLAREPALMPLLYMPGADSSSRFRSLAATTIPRVYHSTAILIPDGRILVAGSNTNVGYDFSGVLFPTELRMEAFSPPYLDPSDDAERPKITSLSEAVAGYRSDFIVQFWLASSPGDVQFNVYAPTFTTHSFSMNQRLLSLVSTKPVHVGSGYASTVTAPPNEAVAPAGYYMLFVVNDGVPSTAAWIQFL